MVNKLTKFLHKQDRKGRELILELIECILNNQLEGSDINKIKDSKDLYRLKKGRIRIIFQKTAEKIIIKKATLRDDNTYNEF